MRKFLLVIKIGALAAEEGVVHRASQAVVQGVEQDRQQEGQSADQPGVVGGHGVSEDQADAGHQQAECADHKNCQHGVNQALAHPGFGFQEAEAQDGVAEAEWEENHRKKEQGGERRREWKLE